MPSNIFFISIALDCEPDQDRSKAVVSASVIFFLKVLEFISFHSLVKNSGTKTMILFVKPNFATFLTRVTRNQFFKSEFLD